MIEQVFKDKNYKLKEKTIILSDFLINKIISINQIIEYALQTKDDSHKATCIEAIEFVTSKEPKIIDLQTFMFVVESLNSKAPRIKWESAKVVSNTASLFENHFEIVIPYLLQNANHKGTVVRWSTAKALSTILCLKTKHNDNLLYQVKIICDKEEKDSIKKIYKAALKTIA